MRYIPMEAKARSLVPRGDQPLRSETGRRSVVDAAGLDMTLNGLRSAPSWQPAPFYGTVRPAVRITKGCATMFDRLLDAVLIFGFPLGVLVGYMWRDRISRARRARYLAERNKGARDP